MENLTVVGMKELNQKFGKIERHLDDIAKSLSTLAKIANRQFPNVQLVKDVYTPDVFPDLNKEENEDEMS